LVQPGRHSTIEAELELGLDRAKPQHP